MRLLRFSGKPVHEQVDDRRGVQREHLAYNQATDDGDAQRPPQLRTCTGSQRQGQTSQEGGHRGHHDRTKAQQARLIDGLLRFLAVLAFPFQREIDHHNAIFLYDANQQDDSDDPDHVQFRPADQQGQ